MWERIKKYIDRDVKVQYNYYFKMFGEKSKSRTSYLCNQYRTCKRRKYHDS